MNDLNILASLLAPAQRPGGQSNVLARLMFPDRSPAGVAPWSGLPPTPGYTEARVAMPLEPQTVREHGHNLLAEMAGLAPASLGANTLMGLMGPAVMGTVGHATQGVRAFHGSDRHLDRFSREALGRNFPNRASRAGTWFSTNADDAAFYGDRMHEVSLRGRYAPLPSMEEMGRNVIDRLSATATNPNVSYEAQRRAERFLNGVELTRDPRFYTDVAASNINKARRAGYDGAVLRGGETVQTMSAPGDNYVVFNEGLVDILRRYGLLGVLSGGAATGAASRDQ